MHSVNQRVMLESGIPEQGSHCRVLQESEDDAEEDSEESEDEDEE